MEKPQSVLQKCCRPRIKNQSKNNLPPIEPLTNYVNVYSKKRKIQLCSSQKGIREQECR